MGILWTLIIGAVAGWLGRRNFKGGSLGLIGNIIVGIIGGAIWLLVIRELHLGLRNWSNTYRRSRFYYFTLNHN